MNTSVASSENTCDFFNFDLTAPQPDLDGDLIKQLGFIPGLQDILMLRQVHALEHATVWVLGAMDMENQVDHQLLGGLSTAQGFYLYGDVNISDLRRAVTLALHRLTSGEWNLAVHPRCGTNVSVEVALTTGLAVGMHLLLPRGPIEQLIGLGVAATTAAEISPGIGSVVQRYLTTAIPFNLAIANIVPTQDPEGKDAYFIRVNWQE